MSAFTFLSPAIFLYSGIAYGSGDSNATIYLILGIAFFIMGAIETHIKGNIC